MINSAATLKRAIKKLLHGLDNVEFYWDDILVHTRTWEEHIKVLRELFRRLLAPGMNIRPTKCLFAVNTVDFLGHRLEEGLIGLHEDNISKIRDAPSDVSLGLGAKKGGCFRRLPFQIPTLGSLVLIFM